MEHHFLKKEDFHSHSNTRDFTAADYALTKRVFKDFEMKNLGEYHNLYVQKQNVIFF